MSAGADPVQEPERKRSSRRRAVATEPSSLSALRCGATAWRMYGPYCSSPVRRGAVADARLGLA